MMMNDQNMTLAAYLRDRNAKTEAWVAEDPDNRWAGTYTEDLAHWDEIGVRTVRDFIRYEMESTIWDLYKDVTGCRPRHMDFASMSFEDLDREYSYLVSQLDRQMDSDEDFPWEDEDTSGWPRIDAEEEAALAEAPEAIDYVAANYQDGWL